MDSSKEAYSRLKNLISSFNDDKKLNKKYLKEFENAINDDLNTPRALQVLWKLVRDEKAFGKILTIKKMDEVFGLDLLKKDKVPSRVRELLEKIKSARKKKDWEKADELKKGVREEGYRIIDVPGDPSASYAITASSIKKGN